MADDKPHFQMDPWLRERLAMIAIGALAFFGGSLYNRLSKVEDSVISQGSRLAVVESNIMWIKEAVKRIDDKLEAKKAP